MSYDLFFVNPKFAWAEFQAYFGSKSLYRISGKQAFYENTQTGVSFVFEFVEPGGEENEASTSQASFHLNYYRPHYFALEAARAVRKFIETFSFAIDDPQEDGMGSGPYTLEGFVRAWSRGNSLAYRSIIRGGHADSAIRTLPTERIHGIWLWNLSRQKNQRDLSKDIFVPGIFHLVVNGEVCTAAVWPDAIPELIPEVDYLIIERKELVPRDLLEGQEKGPLIVPFAEVRDRLVPYQTNAFPLIAYQLPASRTPEDIREFVCGLKASPVSAIGIPADQVLNRELVERWRVGTSPNF